MSHYRINIRTITRAQFNPPAGCSVGDVIASWVYAQQLVDQEDKDLQRRQQITKRREAAVRVLTNWGLSDEDAFKQTRTLIS